MGSAHLTYRNVQGLSLAGLVAAMGGPVCARTAHLLVNEARTRSPHVDDAHFAALADGQQALRKQHGAAIGTAGHSGHGPRWYTCTSCTACVMHGQAMGGACTCGL